MSPEDIQKGITDHTLYQGIIRLTKNRNDAYVVSDNLDADIYIGGLSNRNRSLHGDSVAVRLVDVETVWNERQERESQRRKDRAQKKLQNGKVEVTVEIDIEANEDSNAPTDTNIIIEEGVEVEQREEDHTPVYCGEVVGIIDRSPNSTYAG